MLRLTIFLRNGSKIVLTESDDTDMKKVVTRVRRLMKTESGIVEIQVSSDVLFVDRQEVVACLLSTS